MMPADRQSWAQDHESLPGWELVQAGIADLAAERETVAGELVRSASRRLADLGLSLPGATNGARPNRLYSLLVSEVGPVAAHGRYNALRRRLTSFLRAAGRAQAR